MLNGHQPIEQPRIVRAVLDGQPGRPGSASGLAKVATEPGRTPGQPRPVAVDQVDDLPGDAFGKPDLAKGRERKGDAQGDGGVGLAWVVGGQGHPGQEQGGPVGAVGQSHRSLGGHPLHVGADDWGAESPQRFDPAEHRLPALAVVLGQKGKAVIVIGGQQQVLGPGGERDGDRQLPVRTTAPMIDGGGGIDRAFERDRTVVEFVDRDLLHHEQYVASEL